MKIRLKAGSLTILASLLLLNSSLVLTACSNNNKQNVVIENNNGSQNINNSIIEDHTADEIVLTYYEDTSNEINTLLNSNEKNIKEKVSEKVVILVDFLFYDGEIKGIKLDEITTETKEKIVDIISKIDSSIEEKIPNYKDTISDKCTFALNWLKEKTNSGIVKIDEFLYEKIDDYDKVKEEIGEVIDNTKDDFSEVKDLAKDGFSKVKEYYKNWRDNVRND